MYCTRMVEVGKVENGFVVEVRVPYKPKKEKEKGDCIECYPGSSEKQYIAKSETEVGMLLTRLLLLLSEKYTSEEEFDKAFNEAAKGDK